MKTKLLAAMLAAAPLLASAAEERLFTFGITLSLPRGGERRIFELKEVSRSESHSVVEFSGSTEISKLEDGMLIEATCRLAKARSRKYFQATPISKDPVRLEVNFPTSGPERGDYRSFLKSAISPNVFPVSSCPRSRVVRNASSRLEAARPKLAASREQQLAELHAWLGRLVGRFHARSLLAGDELGPMDMGGGNIRLPEPAVHYALHCTPVGSGSGVSCLFEATDETTREIPLALLFGVDVDRLGIRYLQISANGHARDGFGPLKGDTAELKSPCLAGSACVRDFTMRIRAPAGGGVIEILHEADVRISSGSFRAAPVASRTELRRQ